jgi:16S rRNA (adenine1518-N6/adenine1519-N6)-dimethyltransferase
MEKIIYKKRYGQNFLYDNNILDKITKILDVTSKDLIVEIGPGSGNLTKRLQCYNCQIIAYEIDESLRNKLDLVSNVKTNIIYKDFLLTDIKADLKKYNYDNLYIIANIPYYITTPIITKIINANLGESAILLMVQKEVADRICAKSNCRDYGYFTVFLNSYYNCSKEFDVNKKAFYPVPKVDSTIIKLIPNNIKIKNQEKFNNLIKDAFKQKRKMLKNNLINYDLELINNILKNYNLSLNNRAENIPLEAYIDISNKI